MAAHIDPEAKVLHGESVMLRPVQNVNELPVL
jgi:hypothetical protein